MMTNERRGNTVARVAGALSLLALVGFGTPIAMAAEEQKTFATPEEAVSALVAAVKADDDKAILAILGPDAKPLIDSGDPVADKASGKRFVDAYEQKHSIVDSDDDAKILRTGDDDWDFPIPLVKTDKGWRFDTEEGQQEILDRRIGRNELAAIQVVLAYADAQRDYYDRNPQKLALPAYAQHIASSKGKMDGLYWDTKPGEPESPLGPSFARARAEGYKPGEGKPIPYHGYYYRILKAQGPNAPGGAYDYVAHGEMIGGFALVAYPAEYDVSGVMTFLVNQDGKVFEKDLGPDTEKIATSMKTFDPDESWIEAPTTPPTES